MKSDLVFDVTVRGFTPMARGSEMMRKKRELRDGILAKRIDIDAFRHLFRGRRLAAKIRFYLYSGSSQEGRAKKDLDNLMKIVLDTLPDYMDRAHTEKGLGLMEGDSDELVYEVNAVKELVTDQTKEGIDLELSEWQPRKTAAVGSR